MSTAPVTTAPVTTDIPDAPPARGEQRAEPVTVVVSRHVDTVDVGAYTAWTDEAIAAAAGWPGFLGAGVLHPGTTGDEHHLVYRFGTPDELGAWEESGERAALLVRLEPLVRTEATHRISGLEAWFARPGLPSLVPARWKQALLTLVAVFPLQLLFGFFVAPHLHPLPVRSLVLASTLVVLMTWVIMPPLSSLVGGWLYPEDDQPRN